MVTACFRVARASFRLMLVMCLLVGLESPAEAKKRPEPPPGAMPMRAGEARAAKTDWKKGFLPRFLLGAGGVIAVGLTYSGASWALRTPCRRCGSRRLRFLTNDKRFGARRCLACGFADGV